MAVKTVFLPVAYEFDRITQQVDPGAVERIRASHMAAVAAAEAELDDLLNDGYQVVSQHTVAVTNRALAVLICHKISVPKADDDAADGS